MIITDEQTQGMSAVMIITDEQSAVMKNLNGPVYNHWLQQLHAR